MEISEILQKSKLSPDPETFGWGSAPQVSKPKFEHNFNVTSFVRFFSVVYIGSPILIFDSV